MAGVDAWQLMREVEPGRRLLVIQNPGRGSRNYLAGILAGLQRMKLNTCAMELHEIWEGKTDGAGLVQKLSAILVQQKIGAVLGYGHNGIGDVPLDKGPMAGMRSFWEVRGIPHLMLWLDHPHWHTDGAGLLEGVQGMFRSGNSYHFMKSGAHAADAERILGWPNCCELPAAVDPEQFPVSEQSELGGEKNGGPAFDLVAICTDGGELPEWLKRFVELEDPDPAAIRGVILGEVNGALDALWKAEAPPGMVVELTALGRRWAGYKNAEPFLAAGRHWGKLTAEFPGACWFLTLAYPLWMKAVRILWRLREWERRFYPAYLSRFYKVGMFGGDWSRMGLQPAGGAWVNFLEQSKVYGRGRVALNITDGHDEEGLTLKPFEIAASGVPMLHYHAEGLGRCFEAGGEVEVFRTPREAREKLGALLGDREGRVKQAEAARARVLRDHTWERRVEGMLRFARLPAEKFRG